MSKKKLAQIPITISRSKRACIWERGGSFKNGSSHTILVAGKDMEPLSAIAVKSEENGRHALVPVNIGCYTFEYHKDKNSQESINVWKIEKIDKEKGIAYLELVNNLYDGQWIKEDFTSIFSKIIDLLREKANTKNCTEHTYINKLHIKPFKEDN